MRELKLDPGAEITVGSFWVSSDGPLPGYVHEIKAAFVKATRKFVVYQHSDGSVHRMKRDRFFQLNPNQ